MTRHLADTGNGAGERREVDRRSEIVRIANSVLAASGGHASIHQIAEAAGILPGSLYHHFESKDAIVVELFRQYDAALQQVAEDALRAVDATSARSPRDLILDLCCRIASTAAQHQAAIQLSFYDWPNSDPELTELIHRPQAAIQKAMLAAIRAGMWNGSIRSDAELPTVADRLCQTMLQVGLDILGTSTSSVTMARALGRIFLDGLAVDPPSDGVLDRSEALATADRIIAEWAHTPGPPIRDKAAHIRAVARAEFGRRGYEFTTVRDIAAAAGVGTSTVYRIFDTKDGLLASVMDTFDDRNTQAWNGVLRSASSALEKLDALSWININVLTRFPDEFRIQLAWMRNKPATPPNQFFDTRLHELTTLLNGAIRRGEVRTDGTKRPLFARSVIALLWLPSNIAATVGDRSALLHQRNTVLRGISNRD